MNCWLKLLQVFLCGIGFVVEDNRCFLGVLALVFDKPFTVYQSLLVASWISTLPRNSIHFVLLLSLQRIYSYLILIHPLCGLRDQKISETIKRVN